MEDRRVQPPPLLDGGARYPSWPISSTHRMRRGRYSGQRRGGEAAGQDPSSPPAQHHRENGWSVVIEHERRRILSSSDPDAAPQADEMRLGGEAYGGGQGDPPRAANDGRAGMSSAVERCIHIQ